MFTASFLNGFWSDVLVVLGALGFLLTAAAVGIAVCQMRKTTSAAQAASRAAVEALDESRRQYNRHVIAQALRLLTEVRIFVQNQTWQTASLRLHDLSELLLQVANDDGAWAAIAGRLQVMEKSFMRVSNGDTTFSPSLDGKWHKLLSEIRTKLATNFGPFPTSRD